MIQQDGQRLSNLKSTVSNCLVHETLWRTRNSCAGRRILSRQRGRALASGAWNCSGLRAATARLGRDRQQRRGQFFIEGEKEFHALTVAVELFRVVAEVHGAIQLGVGLGERGRHGDAARPPPTNTHLGQ